MKKIIALCLAIIFVLSALTSCDILENIIGGDEITDENNGNNDGGNDDEEKPDEETPKDDEDENEENEEKPTVYTYVAFTAGEKKTIIDSLGSLIPFIPNNEYYVEEYSLDYEDCREVGINFYTLGNTKEEFDAYREQLQYTFDGEETDDEGDLWYYYTSDEGFYLDISYYFIDGEYTVDIYAYLLIDHENGEGEGDNSGSGNEGSTSGSGGSGNEGDNSGSTDGNYDILTNEGAGLPKGENGVYRVDFTKGKYVKNVSDQGYYLDGCPTIGEPKVLVIPVEFSDATARAQGCDIDKIVTAFCGMDGETDYYSVDRYYYISSYGKLDLDITVLDEWFCPESPSSYYAELTDADGYMNGDQVVLDEALAYLSGIMDLSDYDSDGNGIIDAVVMINTLDIGEDDFHWAYRYWNYYTDDEGYYYEYDGVSANDYLWASYFFIQESYDDMGDAYYTDSSVMNTYTFIHEFGHILGADDYYNTAESGEHPMDSCDIMDAMTGDHNPYSKFNFGWLTSSRLVTAEDSITLSIESFSESGDSIIIANNWDEELGAYQEYYVVIYYTMTGLNGGDHGYFARDGVVVYHVNSTLYREEYEGEIYYDVYNNNTDPSDEYGTEDNLIEFVKSAEGNFTYVEGDSLPIVTDDLGNRLIYSFTVDSIDGNTATITFTKN